MAGGSSKSSKGRIFHQIEAGHQVGIKEIFDEPGSPQDESLNISIDISVDEHARAEISSKASPTRHEPKQKKSRIAPANVGNTSPIEAKKNMVRGAHAHNDSKSPKRTQTFADSKNGPRLMGNSVVRKCLRKLRIIWQNWPYGRRKRIH